MYIAVHVTYPLFLSEFHKLEFFTPILEKYLNIEFHENQSSRNSVVPCGQTEGQTDRHDEANSRFSQVFERA